MDPYANLAKPVRNPKFSTARVPTQNRLPKPLHGIIPVLHTPYDYYE